MANHEEDKVNYYFTYNELFFKCKQLDKKSSKIKHIVYTSKTIISFLEMKNQKTLEEIDSVKKNKVF